MTVKHLSPISQHLQFDLVFSECYSVYADNYNTPVLLFFLGSTTERSQPYWTSEIFVAHTETWLSGKSSGKKNIEIL